MEVEGFLADAVENVGGKLFVLGAGWNVIHVGALPARHSRVGVGLLIRVPYTATNQAHRFELRIETEDGEVHPLGDVPVDDGSDGKLYRIEGEFDVGRPAGLPAGEEQIVPVAANLDGLTFDRAGSYRFVFEIDGTAVKTLPFRINLATQLRMAG